MKRMKFFKFEKKHFFSKCPGNLIFEIFFKIGISIELQLIDLVIISDKDREN